jgi:hypothetical protein
MKLFFLLSLASLIGYFQFNRSQTEVNLAPSENDTIHFANEDHFTNVRQLTFGGDNAEAYFSFDGKYLIYQLADAKNGIDLSSFRISLILSFAQFASHSENTITNSSPPVLEKMVFLSMSFLMMFEK